jgi:hypothetical protein
MAARRHSRVEDERRERAVPHPPTSMPRTMFATRRINAAVRIRCSRKANFVILSLINPHTGSTGSSSAQVQVPFSPAGRHTLLARRRRRQPRPA